MDEQSLRNLRQKTTASERGDVLAYCRHCQTEWSSDELVESYLICGEAVEGLTTFPDGEARRLKAMAIEYQKQTTEEPEIKQYIVNAAYNHHSHTKSCFERHASADEGNGGRKRKEEVTECRYRYPQRMQRQTIVQNASSNIVSWYGRDGSQSDRYIKEVCPKRAPYDVFQNVCCQAISYSKLTCNTNISAVMPGPIGQYTFKYNLKGTQKEDTKEYSGVKEAMQRVLSKLQTYESDRLEAVKRLLAASFAHQKTNVVGAAMASYLTRNRSRFLFSHNMAWCPLKDLRSLVEGGEANVLIAENNKVPFFQCAALHYLCRPLELEDVSAFEFYSKYEVVRKTKRNSNKLLQFSNTNHFRHPSYREKTGTFLQGVRQRSEEHLLKVFQYEFPDTAEFGGSLLEETTEINMEMEGYCKLAVLLFVPFREMLDLQENGSFTLCLREAVKEGHIGKVEQQFLQNLQDTRSNSFRVTKVEDDLQRRTQLISTSNDSQEWSSDMEENIEGHGIDELLQCLEDEMEMTDYENQDEATDWETPCSINFTPLRSKGSERCGYKDLAGMGLNERTAFEALMEVENEGVTATEEGNMPENEVVVEPVTVPTQHDIVTVLVSKTSRRRRTFREIIGNTEAVSVLEAKWLSKKYYRLGKKTWTVAKGELSK